MKDITKDIKRIEVLKLHPDDVLMVSVDCGKLRPSRAVEYMNKIKDDLTEILGTDNVILVMNNSITVQIMHKI